MARAINITTLYSAKKMADGVIQGLGCYVGLYILKNWPLICGLQNLRPPKKYSNFVTFSESLPEKKPFDLLHIFAFISKKKKKKKTTTTTTKASKDLISVEVEVEVDLLPFSDFFLNIFFPCSQTKRNFKHLSQR